MLDKETDIIAEIIDSTAAEKAHEIADDKIDSVVSEQVEHLDDKIDDLSQKIEESEWQQHTNQMISALEPMRSQLELQSERITAIQEQQSQLAEMLTALAIIKSPISAAEPEKSVDDNQETQTLEQPELKPEPEKTKKRNWI